MSYWRKQREPACSLAYDEVENCGKSTCKETTVLFLWTCSIISCLSMLPARHPASLRSARNCARRSSTSLPSCSSRAAQCPSCLGRSAPRTRSLLLACRRGCIALDGMVSVLEDRWPSGPTGRHGQTRPDHRRVDGKTVHVDWKDSRRFPCDLPSSQIPIFKDRSFPCQSSQHHDVQASKRHLHHPFPGQL